MAVMNRISPLADLRQKSATVLFRGNEYLYAD